MVTGAKYVRSSPAPCQPCFDLAYSSSPGGIGFNIAQQLSNKGAKVYIGARTAEKAQAGIAALKQANPNAVALPFVAEISDLGQVKEAAAKVLETEDRLDILVNNAAM